MSRTGPEPVVPPPDVWKVRKSRPTNDPARGNTLREYKKEIKDLLEDLRIDKICSEAGFVRTVVPGQYFVTIGDTELAKLNGPIACRGYTLPRNEESTMAKWCIRENTRIGLVLEVAVINHQGCHGIEIRNNSLSGDQTHSWVRIGTGMNKYVMVMPETVSSRLEKLDGARTVRLVAKLRPKQTSSGTSSSGPQSRTEDTDP